MNGQREARLKNALWIALAAVSAGFILYGWFPRGEWQLVIDKARSICFQCIGLG